MNLDIGKAFTFVGEDPRWLTKLAIGGGLVIAGFIGLFLFIIPGLLVFAIISGYLIQFCRNVINGVPQPLPEWDDFGTKLGEGFKAIVVALVYALPAIIVAMIFAIPQIALSATGNDGAAAAGAGFGLLGNCLSFIIGLAVYVVLPIGMGRLAASNGNIGYALQFGEVFATLRQNAANYVVVALLAYFVGGIIASIGLIACFVGVFFTAFYTQLMQYHLYGQAYRASQGALQPSYGNPYGGQGPYGQGPRPF